MSGRGRPLVIARDGTLVAVMIGVFVLLGANAARRETPTVDEFAHLPAGLVALRHGNFALYPQNPPLGRLLMAIPVALAGASVPQSPGGQGGDWEPWIYGLQFLNANRDSYLHWFYLARLAVVILSAAGGLLLFCWARLRYGSSAALAALFLYVACPNLAAHGRLATVDAVFTTLLVSTFFALDRWRVSPRPWRLILVGVLFALALLTKFTAVLLLPVIAGLVVAARLQREGLSRGLPSAAVCLGTLATIALLVVAAGYAFQATLRPLAELQLESGTGRRLATALPSWLPVPLPRDFVTGLDLQKLDTERGEFGAYFAGEWYERAPAVATPALILFKMPLTALVLLAAAGVASVRRPGPWLDAAFIWLPPVFLLAAFTLGSSLNPAFRYLLPALPFFYLAVSRLFEEFTWCSLKGTLLTAALVALGIDAAATHPHQLAYFNALAGGRGGGYRWFIDSNLDWGQDLVRVKPYMEDRAQRFVYLLYFGHVEPELYGIDYALPPQEPRPGMYVVSVNFAQGYSYVAPNHGLMVRVTRGAPEWLRQRVPDDRIGDSLWVYVVP